MTPDYSSNNAEYCTSILYSHSVDPWKLCVGVKYYIYCTYVTVHAERDHKSAILILRYSGGRQNRQILCFFIFFAQGMRKAL